MRRPTDVELFDNIWGAFGTANPWWEITGLALIDPPTMNAREGWAMSVNLGIEDEGEVVEGVLTADNLWTAIEQIAKEQVEVGPECAKNARIAWSGEIDMADFDAISSDEVMQVAILGEVRW
jgi:hypothetical protein